MTSSAKEIRFVGARHSHVGNAGIRRAICKWVVEERNPAVVPVRRRIQRAQRLLTLEIPDCECVKSPGLNLGLLLCASGLQPLRGVCI